MMYIITQKRCNTDCMHRLHRADTTQKVGITYTAERLGYIRAGELEAGSWELVRARVSELEAETAS